MITIECPECKGNCLSINLSVYYSCIRDAECNTCKGHGWLEIGNLEYIARLEHGEKLKVLDTKGYN